MVIFKYKEGEIGMGVRNRVENKKDMVNREPYPIDERKRKEFNLRKRYNGSNSPNPYR